HFGQNRVPSGIGAWHDTHAKPSAAGVTAAGASSSGTGCATERPLAIGAAWGAGTPPMRTPHSSQYSAPSSFSYAQTWHLTIVQSSSRVRPGTAPFSASSHATTVRGSREGRG